MGLFSFVLVHPYVHALLPSLCHAFVDVMLFVLVGLGAFKERTFLKLGLRQKGEVYSSNTVKDDNGGSCNNRLSDECWNSEMREVQLYMENDWFGSM